MSGNWICYDGQCSLCIAFVERTRRILSRRGFSFVSLQEGWVSERLGLDPNKPPDEMALIKEDDTVLWGADVVVYLSQYIWWALPLYWFSRIPKAILICRMAYRVIAANRHCSLGKPCRPN